MQVYLVFCSVVEIVYTPKYCSSKHPLNLAFVHASILCYFNTVYVVFSIYLVLFSLSATFTHFKIHKNQQTYWTSKFRCQKIISLLYSYTSKVPTISKNFSYLKTTSKLNQVISILSYYLEDDMSFLLYHFSV
jgi:hypothetical protein